MDLKATELTLGLPGADQAEPRGSKRVAEEGCKDAGAKHGKEAPMKAQVVGWPPVRSFRRNAVMASKTAAAEAECGGGMFVKVSMDGAPYLRKIDLKSYKGYKELLGALEGIFKCFNIGELGKENSNKSEYALTYEDKDGDWMLVGDVPFDMFISTCKRLRIMKGSEARGLGSS